MQKLVFVVAAPALLLSILVPLTSGSLRCQTMLKTGADCGSRVAASPRDYTTVGKVSFFVATTKTSGKELWKTDGTASGTVMVKDIRLGPASSDPQWLTNVNGTLFFSAYDGTHGIELWKSDGTAKGTVMVKDIRLGAGNAVPRELVALGRTLYFSASTTLTGLELWKSDGTESGTVLVKDIYPGSTGSAPTMITVVGNALFFRAVDVSTGREIWVSDGTGAGTRLVKDIYAGSPWSSPSELTAVGSSLFFRAYEPKYGNELYVTDGTSSGTQVIDVVAGATGSNPYNLADLGGKVVFGSSSDHLWISDGSTTGTKKLKRTGRISNPTIAGLTLFFTTGGALWSTDGTTTGTVVVKSILGSATSLHGLLGTLFFRVGNELWRSNGAGAGTVVVRSFPASEGLLEFSDLSGRLLISTIHSVWSSTGTLAGTQEIKNLSTCGGTPVGHMVNLEQILVFASDSQIHGTEVWTSDGTQTGTALLKDLRSGSVGSSPNALTVVGRGVYFGANPVTTRTHLYRTDGTVAGTRTVANFPVNSPVTQITEVRDFVYFFVGGVMHQTNGTTARSLGGNRLGSADPVALDGALYWTDLSNSLERTIGPKTTSVGPRAFELEPLGKTLIYSSSKGIGQTDGSSTWGTLKTFFSRPSSLSACGNVVFFAAQSNFGVELWKTDGTVAGTVLVKDINTGTASSHPREITCMGSAVYFRADDGKTGEELWRSDGTATGTTRVMDIYPGPLSSRLSGMTLVGAGAHLVFAAGDEDYGLEVWRSDGTASGTFRVTDIASGAASAVPDTFVSAGSSLFFKADNGTNGEQLWTIPLKQLEVAVAETYGTGCLGLAGIPQIGTVGPPLLGNSSFAVDVRAARKGSSAILFLGAARTNVDLSNGCSLYVSPLLFGLGATVNAVGQASVALGIPSSVSILGEQAFFQWVIDDKVYGAYYGTANLSGGLQVMIGR